MASGDFARRKGTDTPPPHGPPGSGAGCYPPQAVLTRPVTALILYISFFLAAKPLERKKRSLLYCYCLRSCERNP
jgi:hypothetical protein